MRRWLIVVLMLACLPVFALDRNTSSQYLLVKAWDMTTDAGKTGDAANITAKFSKDGGECASSDDTNPSEVDSGDAPGWYKFTLTQAETNCTTLVAVCTSSTANIKIEDVRIETQIVPATATALATAQSDLDLLTGVDGVTLATLQANYAPATATALSTAQADLDLLTGVDGATLATLQANYAPAIAGDEMDLVAAPNGTAVTAIQSGLATSLEVGTAQADLDILTGVDGATLATLQANYAPATATDLGTAQADLDLLTGVDGATLATLQGNYAPAIAGDEMDLVAAPNGTAVTAIQSGLATGTDLATAQADLDTLTGTDGATVSTASVTAIQSGLELAGAAAAASSQGEAATAVGTLNDIAAADVWTAFDATQLAKFVTVDTTETTAAAGSVAKLAQADVSGLELSGAASTAVGTLNDVSTSDIWTAFDSTQLAKFATVDTGETTAAAGSVAELSQGGTAGDVTLAASQPNYAPAKAGDQMDLIDAPNSTAVTAIQAGLALTGEAATYSAQGEAATAASSLATSTALATAQADLDTLTGTDGATVSSASVTAIQSGLELSGAASTAVGTLNDITGADVWTALDQTALAKFVTTDTGETTAADGSVAKLAQGGTSGDVTLAASQPNYAPAKAGDAMTLANDAVSADVLKTDAVTEIQSGLATGTAQTTAQADLDILTGTDGALLATDAVSAAAVATDAVTELQAGIATSTALDAVPTAAENVTAIEASSVIKKILSFGAGKFVKDGDAYTYYDTDGTTPLFVVTLSNTGRTVE